MTVRTLGVIIGAASLVIAGSAGCKQDASPKAGSGSAAPVVLGSGGTLGPAAGSGAGSAVATTSAAVAPGAANEPTAPGSAALAVPGSPDGVATGTPPTALTVAAIPDTVARPTGLGDAAKLIASAEFTDASGRNLVWLTSQGDPNPKAGEPRLLLQVHHVIRNADGGGSPNDDRVLRHVKELVECTFLSASFARDTLRVTDLDHDEVAEVSLAYSTWCNKDDESTRKQKLLMLEGGEKFILRAEVTEGIGEGYGGDGDTYGGGERTGAIRPEPAKDSWPKGFYAFARERWTAQFE